MIIVDWQLNTVTVRPIYLIYIEPSGPPLNVRSTVSGSKIAEITWSPPVFQHQNGPILYYVIRLEDQWYGTDIIEINSTAPSQRVVVNNLEEYARYSCQVAAATSAGVGLYSDEIFFTTFEDSTCKCWVNCNSLMIITHFEHNQGNNQYSYLYEYGHGQ